MAMGNLANADHYGSFVWNHYNFNDSFSTKYPNQFIINSNNGTGINTNKTILNGKRSILSIAGPPLLLHELETFIGTSRSETNTIINDLTAADGLALIIMGSH